MSDSKDVVYPASKIPAHAVKVFGGVVFDIYQWEQQLYDGTTATFEAARRAYAVSIIPVVDDKVVIIHEEQPGREPNIGFPGGHMEPGEDPVTAARRELLEETGLEFKNLKLVLLEDIGGHKVDWWCYRFVATGLASRREPKPDPGEKIAVELVDFARAKQLAAGNVYMSHQIMDQVGSLEELLRLSEAA